MRRYIERKNKDFFLKIEIIERICSVKSMVFISVCLWFWFVLLSIFVVLFCWFLVFVLSQKIQATGSVIHYYLYVRSCCCVWPFSSFDRNYLFLFLFLFFPSRGAHTHGERVQKNTRGQNFLLFKFPFFSFPTI